ncbi:NADH:flavin oxidoreductase [Sphingomonas bacterium]|uniref:NADH:flavin oxidoreductase n=1 Tax=Sphingomonas bacterium TaxID=1895847 RepID=UPI00266FD2E2|nr:NADH:flavin oxidoreductase [Sphingomonas bacterium]
MFEPFTLGRATLSNRIAMAPMTRGYASNGVPGENVAEYYRRRAQGGVGLIITEGTWIAHPAASNEASIPDFHGEALRGWRRVVEAVHEAGGRIMPQLWHVGLIHKKPPEHRRVGETPAQSHHIGPSGISGGVGVPLFDATAPMSLADVDSVIEAFAAAARAAMDLGFDGVALHGAHGYIIDQFLWHATNRRTDRYGGSHRDRATFAAEIVAEIRRRTAPDFPIILRYSQWKLHDYDARLAENPMELEALLAPIAEAGVDLIDCSQRRFWEPTFAGSDLNLAGWTKRLTGKPTMTVGSVGLDRDFMSSLFDRDKSAGTTDLVRLVAMFERGDFDLVGVGRALIVDPEWTRKVKEDRMDELLPYDSRALEALI